MLNDWSDRPQPPARRKPFVASGEFWLGVATVFFGLLIAFGLIDLFFLD